MNKFRMDGWGGGEVPSPPPGGRPWWLMGGSLVGTVHPRGRVVSGSRAAGPGRALSLSWRAIRVRTVVT